MRLWRKQLRIIEQKRNRLDERGGGGYNRKHMGRNRFIPTPLHHQKPERVFFVAIIVANRSNMNRTEFLAKIQKVTKLSDEKIKKLEKILDEHTPVGNSNKEKIIFSLKKELGMSEKDADKLYNDIAKIFTEETADKVKGALSEFVNMFK